MALALDGAVATGFINGAASTTIVSSGKTTTSTNDVIVALIGICNGSNSQLTVSSVSGGGLTWTKRAAQAFLTTGGFQYTSFEVWYAIAAGTLSAAAITATLSGSSVAGTIQVFAVSGANTASPWDPVSTSVKTNLTSTKDTPQTTITTTNANDFVFAAIFNSSGTITSWTTQASYTTLGNLSGFSGSPNFIQAYEQGEYQIVSATQSGATVGFSDITDSYCLFVDAIKQASAGAAFLAKPNIPVLQAVNRASYW